MASENRPDGLRGQLAVTGLLLLMLCPSLSLAQEPAGRPRLIVDASASHDVSRLFWSIGPSRAARLSELAFQDVTLRTYSLSAVYHFGEPSRDGLSLAMAGARGTVTGGRLRDSDYRHPGDDEHWRSSADVTGNTSATEAAAVGWRLHRLGGPLPDLTFWLGMVRQEHTLRLQNGVQEFPRPDSLVGRPLTDLDSRYVSHWTSPYVAVEPLFRAGPVQVAGLVEIHLVSRYRGEGTWNLREELAQPLSFEQKATGWGVRASLSGSLRIPLGLSLLLTGVLTRLAADEGSDVSYLANGGQVRMTLRRAVWTNRTLQVGLRRCF